MNHNLKRSLIALLTAFTLLTALPAHAAADSTCNPGRSGDNTVRYTGWWRAAYPGYSFGAVGAYIEKLTPYVSFISTSASFINLGNAIGGLGSGWVQAGYINRNIAGYVDRDIYVERRDPTHGYGIWFFGEAAANSVHDFQIARISGNYVRGSGSIWILHKIASHASPG